MSIKTKSLNELLYPVAILKTKFVRKNTHQKNTHQKVPKR